MNDAYNAYATYLKGNPWFGRTTPEEVLSFFDQCYPDYAEKATVICIFFSE